MRRRRIGERVISPRIPTHIEKMKHSTLEIADGLREFCELYLRAAIEIKAHNVPKGYINISDEFTAYAIKLMVQFGGDDGMLDVTVEGEEEFRIRATFKGGLPCIDNLADIFAAARRAGFTASTDEDSTVTLTAPLIDTRTITIYVPKPNVFISVLYDVFFM